MWYAPENIEFFWGISHHVHQLKSPFCKSPLLSKKGLWDSYFEMSNKNLYKYNVVTLTFDFFSFAKVCMIVLIVLSGKSLDLSFQQLEGNLRKNWCMS